MPHEQDKLGGNPGEIATDEPDRNVIIDLNTADEQTLANLPDIGPARARVLVEHRPYSDWSEVQQLPDIGGLIVDALAMHGVQLSPHPEGEQSA